MATENDGEMLARLGTDAHEWANEFLEVVGSQIQQAIDEGKQFTPTSLLDTMRTWFANAIEAGLSAGHAAAQGVEDERKVWFCKIGFADEADMTGGSDGPMREAVEAAFIATIGREAEFTFSGWGGKLTEPELAVVEDRLPDA